MEGKYFTLNTGASIPALGLGTWQPPPGEVSRAVLYALKTGYKHIDAAYCYGNEVEVGDALKTALQDGFIKREDIFVTTKLWCTYHTRVEENLNLSLASLGLDYVDLYLMHWPCAMNPYGSDAKFPKLADGSRDLQKDRTHVETYLEMEQLLKSGKVKSIGVANYSLRYLEELLPQVSVIPAVNQIENHPYLPQQEIVNYCKLHNIHVTAYSPFGSSGSPLLGLKEVRIVAAKHNVAPGNVLLNYHFARGSSVLAKSVNPGRIDENKEFVKLEEGDINVLEQISSHGLKRFVYPAFGVDFGFPDQQY